nr:nucleotidyltransferase [Chloroflexota bacterium]
MALISRAEIVGALARLGELAETQGHTIQLVAVGGAVMVLAFNARQSTRDVDVAILLPREARIVRELAKIVAHERNWPEDWLNDGAKGYLVGLSTGPVIFSAPGIEVRAPAIEQLLAMKLSAWRDDVDIADARRLLAEIGPIGSQAEIWDRVEPYLIPGDQLKAQYAFQDLWELLYGNA